MEEITDSNIHNLVNTYLDGNSNLPPIGTWDVSKVTNMSGLFSEADEFNENINNWDVSNVTDMSNMFDALGDTVFNQPLDLWNVSKVTNMSGMFSNARVFNQPLNSWNVSNVTNMSFLFMNSAFNQPIDSWDVSKVTNMDSMFMVTLFNQPLNSWNVGNVTNMQNLFTESKFNQPLDLWDVSKVTNMAYMFADSDFNQSLSTWNVNNVLNMYQMFDDSKIDITTIADSIINWNINRNVSLRNVQPVPAHPRNPINLRYDELIQARLKVLETHSPEEKMTYEECFICSESLNNVSGPGPGRNCTQFCNDVVTICANNHKTHRACVLSSCNMMGSLRSNKCPYCQVDLITNCNNFRNRQIVPKIPTDQLSVPVETRGGFRKRKRKTYKRKKHRRSKKRHSIKRFTRR
jgi:surface protein